ncbi:MAG: hypothetical protein AAGA30_04750 [Planctomycetota bacterium]
MFTFRHFLPTYSILILLSGTCIAEDPSPSVLFVRGAERSGGFLEAGNDASRTEHLADIFNLNTNGGNHGWGELRQALEGAGFEVSQIIEPLEPGAPSSGQTQGAPIAFQSMYLFQYDVIMFGSNNAAYSGFAVNAVEDYIRAGGAAIFISDANFGSDWADASNSDQDFLDRFGLIMHQDQGTYAITSNEFLVPDHPIFVGVSSFDGEGVTPIEVGNLTAGVSIAVLARAEGNTRLNDPPFGNNNQGPSVSSDANDAVLLCGVADFGRVIGHFDRNTFFNLNGAGTNINRLSNRQYAINLFAYAASPVFQAGDVNGDNAINLLDIGPFVDLINDGDYLEPADINCDRTVNLLDVQPFVDLLNGN